MQRAADRTAGHDDNPAFARRPRTDHASGGDHFVNFRLMVLFPAGNMKERRKTSSSGD